MLSRGYRYFEDGCVVHVKPNSRGWQHAFLGNDDEADDDAGILWYVRETVEEFACSRFAGDPDFAAQVQELAERIVEEEIAEPPTFLASDGKTVLHRSMHRFELW